jgi:hypothetical protein
MVGSELKLTSRLIGSVGERCRKRSPSPHGRVGTVEGCRRGIEVAVPSWSGRNKVTQLGLIDEVSRCRRPLMVGSEHVGGFYAIRSGLQLVAVPSWSGRNILGLSPYRIVPCRRPLIVGSEQLLQVDAVNDHFIIRRPLIVGSELEKLTLVEETSRPLIVGSEPSDEGIAVPS